MTLEGQARHAELLWISLHHRVCNPSQWSAKNPVQAGCVKAQKPTFFSNPNENEKGKEERRRTAAEERPSGTDLDLSEALHAVEIYREPGTPPERIPHGPPS